MLARMGFSTCGQKAIILRLADENECPTLQSVQLSFRTAGGQGSPLYGNKAAGVHAVLDLVIYIRMSMDTYMTLSSTS